MRLPHTTIFLSLIMAPTFAAVFSPYGVHGPNLLGSSKVPLSDDGLHCLAPSSLYVWMASGFGFLSRSIVPLSPYHAFLPARHYKLLAPPLGDRYPECNQSAFGKPPDLPCFQGALPTDAPSR
jgi:hypothetical protein